MFHVRQGRREFVPGVHRADARRRGAPEGPGRTGPETVLLPSDDPLSRGTHRRSLAVRLSDLALGRRTRGEGFLGLQSFERFRRVRGVAWFERGDQPVFPLTGNPTSLGCWRLRVKSGRTHLTSGSKPDRFKARVPPQHDGGDVCRLANPPHLGGDGGMARSDAGGRYLRGSPTESDLSLGLD